MPLPPRLTSTLSCPAPFSWDAMLHFYSARAIPGVERVRNDGYARSIVINGQPAVIAVRPSGRTLKITMSGVAPASRRAVLARLRRIFDLDAPMPDIVAVLRADAALRRRLDHLPGPRVVGAWNGFELAVRAILGQQVSVAAATTLSGRVARRYGEPLPAALAAVEPGVEVLFPEPDKLARVRFNRMGLIGSRIETIRGLARAVASGSVDLETPQDAESFRAGLTRLRGIGDWTAQYVSMRAMKHPDAFPSSDLGLLKALKPGETVTPKELERRAERWRPWRAYAASLLWYAQPSAGG